MLVRARDRLSYTPPGASAEHFLVKTEGAIHGRRIPVSLALGFRTWRRSPIEEGNHKLALVSF